MKLLERIRKMISSNSRRINESINSISYKYGGVGDRNVQAIYYPPRRGKLKGYMR